MSEMKLACRLGSSIVLAAVFCARVQCYAGPGPVLKTESVKIGPGGVSVDQALAKPDSTKLVGPDGTGATVGDLRKFIERRKLVDAYHGKADGATAKTSFGPGANIARDYRQLATIAEAGASKTAVTQALRPQEGIAAVDGRSSGFAVTPGKRFTIAGYELGDAMGQASLFGNFPGSKAPLIVIDWKADSVQAVLPDGLRGVLDQPVILQVITAAGKTHRLEGGRFVASREEVTITSNIARLLRFQSSPNWPLSMGPALEPVALHDDGTVARAEREVENNDCPRPGSDTITIVEPGRGFVVTALIAQWGRTDSGNGDLGGNAGSRSFFPGYSFGDWSGDSVPVRWGVWRSHTSPFLMVPAVNVCESDYRISVTLTGPAGVSPF